MHHQRPALKGDLLKILKFILKSRSSCFIKCICGDRGNPNRARFDFSFGKFFGRIGEVVRDYVVDTFESRLERVVIKPVTFIIVAIGPPG